jgi:hypothetical protein
LAWKSSSKAGPIQQVLARQVAHPAVEVEQADARDEDVEAAVALEHRVDRRVARRRVGGVAVDHDRGRRVTSQRGALRLVPLEHGNGGAGGGEGVVHGPADARSGADHEGPLAGQRHGASSGP